MCELLGEDCPNGGLIVHGMGKIHVDEVSVDVGVFSRVDSCKVLVVDKDRTLRRG